LKSWRTLFSKSVTRINQWFPSVIGIYLTILGMEFRSARQWQSRPSCTSPFSRHIRSGIGARVNFVQKRGSTHILDPKTAFRRKRKKFQIPFLIDLST
jgi:hypothetical protein